MNDVRAAFDELMGQLDYPMFIVTTVTRETRAGCLIGFATQTSIEPSRFVVCLSHANRTYRAARAADMLGVHLVPADADALAELFGGETGDRVDKFARCEWQPGPQGVPILDGCPNWFVGRILRREDVGDHDMFLLEPVAAAAGSAPGEFTFRRAKWIDPGHPA